MSHAGLWALGPTGVPGELPAAAAAPDAGLWALAFAGWLVALVAARALYRRLALVARAEHELRSPLAALALAAEAARRRARRDDALLAALDTQLARASAALADLAAARSGRAARARPRPVALAGLVRSSATALAPLAEREGRALGVDWRAGRAPVHADPDRLAQALGNLISNAVEHGSGPVVVRGRRVGRRVRVEVASGRPWPPAGRRPEPPPEPPPGERTVVALRPHRGARGHGLAIAADAALRAGGRLTVAGDPDAPTYALELPHDDDAPAPDSDPPGAA